MTYQIDVGAANQNYRKAEAQANDTLTIEIWNDDPDAEANYEDAMSAVEEAKTAAIDAAYADFATAVQPAITLQGTVDANAEEADTETNASANLTDIEANNAAVDTYDDAESADYATQQTADATALDVMQVANANGQAAAIAAYDQANPSPWADLASWQAAANAAQQVAVATATQTRSASEAQSTETDEQAQSDATTAKDDAQAEAEETQTDSDAETADAEALAQAAATDTVFTYLPDVLVAPSEGPTPVLTPDYLLGYEANDFYLYPTIGAFLQTAGEWCIGWEPFELSAPSSAAASYTPEQPPTIDLNSTSGGPTVSGSTYGIGVAFGLHDMDRNLLPQTLDYAPPMHFTGPSAELLDLVNTPSNIGPGGYSQSPLPTTLASKQLANPAPTKSASPSLMDVPALKEPNGTKPSDPAEPNTPPAPPPAAANADGTQSGETTTGGSVTLVICILLEAPDPATEAEHVADRSQGEPEVNTDKTQKQLSSADDQAQETENDEAQAEVSATETNSGASSEAPTGSQKTGPVASLTPLSVLSTVVKVGVFGVMLFLGDGTDETEEEDSNEGTPTSDPNGSISRDPGYPQIGADRISRYGRDLTIEMRAYDAKRWYEKLWYDFTVPRDARYHDMQFIREGDVGTHDKKMRMLRLVGTPEEMADYKEWRDELEADRWQKGLDKPASLHVTGINRLPVSSYEATADYWFSIDEASVRNGDGYVMRAVNLVFMPGGPGESLLFAAAPLGGAASLPTGRGLPLIEIEGIPTLQRPSAFGGWTGPELNLPLEFSDAGGTNTVSAGPGTRLRFDIIGNKMWVGMWEVAPELQGKGAGRELFREALRRFPQVTEIRGEAELDNKSVLLRTGNVNETPFARGIGPFGFAYFAVIDVGGAKILVGSKVPISE